MEKEYKLIEELQKICNKELTYKIYKDDSWVIGSSYIKIENINIIDNNIIDKIKEYTNDYIIDTNYKKIGLILIINFNAKITSNLVSDNL